MGTLHKMEDIWKKGSLFMMSLYVSGICILQVIKLNAWVILFDTLVGILMDGVHGWFGVAQRNLNVECYWNFVCRRNYVRQIHGLRERKSGR